jgi:transcription antitermination factor NusG
MVSHKSIKNSQNKSILPICPDELRRWVCVELSSTGEREKDINSIIRAVHRILGRPVEVFVPAVSQKVRGESQTMVYMDGYIFIQYFHDIHYIKLQDTNYFHMVLNTTVLSAGKRKYQYSLLDDKALAPMRIGVQNLKESHNENVPGDKVKIIKGDYKNLIGVISEVYDKENIQVSVELRSKKLLLDFPVSYIQKNL